VFDRRWSDEPEPVVVASKMSSGIGQADAGYLVPEYNVPAQPGRAAPRVPRPRRVDPELVAGKPVFVLYRPSRGLEVREDTLDTDRVAGR
jgi:hypothetical protein